MNENESIRLFKALSSKARFRIVKSLLNGERCACELPEIIGSTQSNTSMHLSKLTDMGIVSSRRDGKKIIYSIKDKKVLEIFRSLEIKG